MKFDENQKFDSKQMFAIPPKEIEIFPRDCAHKKPDLRFIHLAMRRKEKNPKKWKNIFTAVKGICVCFLNEFMY
jgi:hypothetical protein